MDDSTGITGNSAHHRNVNCVLSSVTGLINMTQQAMDEWNYFTQRFIPSSDNGACTPNCESVSSSVLKFWFVNEYGIIRDNYGDAPVGYYPIPASSYTGCVTFAPGTPTGCECSGKYLTINLCFTNGILTSVSNGCAGQCYSS